MSQIKIEDIRTALKEDGWELISKEYKNLDTNLIFKCDEGHEVISTWKKIRQKRVCPICEKNKYKKSLAKSVVPKKKGVSRIIGVDQATYTSGWSVFDDGKLVDYGIFETTENTETKRIEEVKNWLLNMVELWKPDKVGIEDIHLESTGRVINTANGLKVYKILAHLQGVLMILLLEEKVSFDLCSPSSWRKKCGVTGRTKSDKKKSAQLKVKKEFDITVTEDEADAICIGKYTSDLYNKEKIINWEE
jgi:Holliday junction resolvasome RuvABC endonuclease subunit